MKNAPTDADLERFAQQIAALRVAYFEENGLTYAKPGTRVNRRKLFAGIDNTETFPGHPEQVSGVHCFVDLSNGDILKPKTYSSPEKKNPRGNIFDADPLAGVTPNGVAYLR